MHVRRSRGALSGILLVLLGVWGAIIPFVGPAFDYAYTPDTSWHYTAGRLWLEILPGVATIVGGLVLLVSAHRLVSMIGGWLAVVGGAWFVVGQPLSLLWNSGVQEAGVPTGTGFTRIAMEQIGFFLGLGVVIVFLGALALGRMTVVGVKDLEHAESSRYDDDRETRSDPYAATTPRSGTTTGSTTGPATTGPTTTESSGGTAASGTSQRSVAVPTEHRDTTP